MDHGAAERVQTDLSSSPIDDRSIEGLAVTPTAISTAASSDSIFEIIERRGGGRPSAWPSALSMLLGDQPSGVTSGSTEPLSCRWTHSEQGNSPQESCSEFSLPAHFVSSRPVSAIRNLRGRAGMPCQLPDVQLRVQGQKENQAGAEDTQPT